MTANLVPQLVDVSGRPLRARADSGAAFDSRGVFYGYRTPYQAATPVSQEMGDWNPQIRSPDSEINQYRDRMVARSRDQSRNNGWVAGGIDRILDSTIGTRLRLKARPDWRFLKYRFGKAFDATWAAEYASAAEALWRGYSGNIGRWADVERQMTLGQQWRVGLRHKLIDGDGLSLAYWLPDRVGVGGADYATAFQLIDPDRLCNPMMQMDTKNLRGGVQISDDGLPLGVHIRKAEPNDWYNAIESFTWEYVPYEDEEDGWRRVFHDFDHHRAGQHRGIGVFTSVLEHMRMLAKYYGVELQAAAVAAIFGTYVTSPYDPALAQDALDGDSELSYYQQLRADWARERPAMLNGVKVPTLAPGEQINAVDSKHPHTNFGPFAMEMQCVFAAATGIPIEQVRQDWSKTNYSATRAASVEAFKTLTRRKDDFCDNTATPQYALWLHEPMDRGELPLPAGAPRYIEAMTPYATCRWLGVPRGWVDPTKEPAGSVLRMEAGISNLDMEGDEQGVDWEEVAEQRAVEAARYGKLGLPQPKWVYGGVDPAGQDANDTGGQANAR